VLRSELELASAPPCPGVGSNEMDSPYCHLGLASAPFCGKRQPRADDREWERGQTLPLPKVCAPAGNAPKVAGKSHLAPLVDYDVRERWFLR
jgi:hypothetical protein